MTERQKRILLKIITIICILGALAPAAQELGLFDMFIDLFKMKPEVVY